MVSVVQCVVLQLEFIGSISVQIIITTSDGPALDGRFSFLQIALTQENEGRTEGKNYKDHVRIRKMKRITFLIL